MKNKISAFINSNNNQLCFMASLGLIFVLIFAYIPMYGLVLAFKDGDGYLNILDAMFKSSWAGFDNFTEFLLDEEFIHVMWNTIGLNLLQLCINFPIPIIFAILINEVYNVKFKKSVQTIAYAPHFLSWITYGGIILMLINLDTGVLNDILITFNIVDHRIDFGEPQYFWGLIILSSLMKGIGWGSLIYVAAISGIDQSLFEAAKIDGANRFQKIMHITVPSISPTIKLFFILSLSSILNSGFDHIWIFQNQINLSRSEVIDTYVYKYGIVSSRYSYSTAVGLFKSAVAFILLIIGHNVSKKVTGEGIF